MSTRPRGFRHQDANQCGQHGRGTQLKPLVTEEQALFEGMHCFCPTPTPGGGDLIKKETNANQR